MRNTHCALLLQVPGCVCCCCFSPQKSYSILYFHNYKIIKNKSILLESAMYLFFVCLFFVLFGDSIYYFMFEKSVPSILAIGRLSICTDHSNIQKWKEALSYSFNLIFFCSKMTGPLSCASGVRGSRVKPTGHCSTITSVETTPNPTCCGTTR